ncbi:MAG: glycosyl transferase family 28 [Flavobacteriales bacterium]|jgi:predicted glycosyltransferase|nr:glycosyl transferase family 28 [Flavobacteriales bacterium]
MLQGKRILVAPLDWGLGHSTRCIPIIQRLIDRGATPIIGADNGPLALLQQEFPDLEHVRIPGITIRYAKGESQLWSMARQFPEMMRSVRAETALFDHIRKDLRLDAVISDQRFGLRSSTVPSVVITHQVFPFTPIAQGALRKLNVRHLSRFDRCWIMDDPEAPGLAGELSHGASLPRNTRYIGTVSRMARHGSAVKPATPYRIVAVISGPEPHRTILDDLLTEALQRIDGQHVLVRGRPHDPNTVRLGGLTCVPHLPGVELAEHMRNAELIVSRSGYTTLMDLVALGRSALIIPTPGQAEQEYLGTLHEGTGRFLVQRQDNIDLGAALIAASMLTKHARIEEHPHLERALDELGTLLG